MNAKDRSEAWAIDQLDPDNWLEIPDFGILPLDVVFEGFAYPLVSTTLRGRALRVIIREQVKTARSLIRTQHLTLADVKANYLQVLDMMTDGLETEKIDATPAQAMSTCYMVFMSSANQASQSSYGGYENVITARTIDRCYSEIAESEGAIRSLAEWSINAKTQAEFIHGTELKRIVESQREKARLAGLASGEARSKNVRCTPEVVAKQYQTLMATGTEERNIAAKLATRFNVTSNHIRKLRRQATNQT